MSYSYNQHVLKGFYTFMLHLILNIEYTQLLCMAIYVCMYTAIDNECIKVL